jgi:hypothetical protein
MIIELIAVASPVGGAYGAMAYWMIHGGWTRLQGIVWPLTASHRLYRKYRPLPVLLHADALRRLEAEVGVGPYSVPMVRAAYKEMLRLVQESPYAHCHPPFQDAQAEYFRIMGEYFPAETPIKTLVWSGSYMRSCLDIKPPAPAEESSPKTSSVLGWNRVDDQQLIQDMAANLYKQLPTPALRTALDIVSRFKADVEDAADMLEQMQTAASSVAEGFERYETLAEALERYDELREGMAKSLRHGDHLMKVNATERLVRWCCRHHDPRKGWFFPQPGHRDFNPWRESENDPKSLFD